MATYILISLFKNQNNLNAFYVSQIVLSQFDLKIISELAFPCGDSQNDLHLKERVSLKSLVASFREYHVRYLLLENLSKCRLSPGSLINLNIYLTDLYYLQLFYYLPNQHMIFFTSNFFL